MAENKMAEVAAMFGKKLGEEFKIKQVRVIKTAKFTEDGLELYDSLFGKWVIFSGTLQDLLTGEAVIVDGKE